MEEAEKGRFGPCHWQKQGHKFSQKEGGSTQFPRTGE